MDNKEKLLIMANVSKEIVKLIDKRLSAITDTVTALKTSALDIVDVEIQKMRELKSIELLMIIQELKNLKETIIAMYPNG